MTFSITEHLTAAMQAQQAGRHDEADRLCAEILAEDAAQLDAWHFLVAGKFMRGLHLDALALLEQAFAHHPENLELHVLAGHSTRALGDMARAALHYARAVEAKPDYAEARVMLAWSLRALDRRDEARTQYLEAIRINPDLIEAHNNLGVLYHDAGELEPAIAAYREVLVRQPQHIEARRNRAAALRALGRVTEALAEFETLVAFNPGHAYSELMIRHSRRELADWRTYAADVEKVREIATAQAGAFSPFLLFAWPVSPDVLLQAAHAYALRSLPPVPAVAPQPRTQPIKLRIGYIAADYRDHVLTAVVPEVFERHDRSNFEIFAYSYGPDDGGAGRKRIQNAVDHFVDIRAVADDTATARIRADQIDILVDLTAFTGSVRHGIPMRRPAPLMINWLGYPGTSGSPAVDYLVADAFTVPPEAEKYFSEKIIRLPGAAQPHDSTRAVATTQGRAVYGLPEKGLVFCSFNYVQKLTPEIFAAWMALLREVPGSVLWLRADKPEVLANLRREAAAAGVEASRLVFAARAASNAEHLARYGAADLALDSFPYGAHTTANDALWVGCPLLTLTGETVPSRVAGGILTAAGLPELVTTSLAAYQDTALRLAKQPEALAALKAKVKAAREAAHFDTARFTRRLEAGFKAAWKIRAEGGETRHITVAADT